MKNIVKITIESKNVRRIMKDDANRDPEVDQVIDWPETKRFQQAIHEAVSAVIERFVTDDERFEEEVADMLDHDYDTETLYKDRDAPELNDLGEIKITVTTNMPKKVKQSQIS